MCLFVNVLESAFFFTLTGSKINYFSSHLNYGVSHHYHKFICLFVFCFCFLCEFGVYLRRYSVTDAAENQDLQCTLSS